MACCIAACLKGQKNPMELLRRVQQKVTDSLDRVPKYMCTETIDRTQYQPEKPGSGMACDEWSKPGLYPIVSDRLRLDVAMAASGEIFSWSGESQFDDRDLFGIVRGGAISTGSFASFLATIFRGDEASFTYNGDTHDAGGRVLSEFGFRVPFERSHYYYGEGAHRVTTGYGGTFRVDSKTADLVHLEVMTLRLPAVTAACRASTTLDYSQVRMKDIDFLLPSASLLRIDRIDGSIAENRTAFSNCHEFLGESTISFGDPPPSEPAAPARSAPPVMIPPGLPFRIVLTQTINVNEAAAGDRVNARLSSSIKDGEKVLVHSGASVQARIVRIQRSYGSNAGVTLDLKLETVTARGVAVRLVAAPEVEDKFEKSGNSTLQRRVELGTLLALEDRAASLFFRGHGIARLNINGAESEWRTAEPPK